MLNRVNRRVNAINPAALAKTHHKRIHSKPVLVSNHLRHRPFAINHTLQQMSTK